jgi:hypothetical protein
MSEFINYTIDQKHRYFERLFSNASSSLRNTISIHYHTMITSDSHEVLDWYFHKVHRLIDQSHSDNALLTQNYRNKLIQQEAQTAQIEENECNLLLKQLD